MVKFLLIFLTNFSLHIAALFVERLSFPTLNYLLVFLKNQLAYVCGFISFFFLTFILFFKFCFIFGHTHGMWEFSGQGSNLCMTAGTQAPALTLPDPNPLYHRELLKGLFLNSILFYLYLCLSSQDTQSWLP